MIVWERMILGVVRKGYINKEALRSRRVKKRGFLGDFAWDQGMECCGDAKKMWLYSGDRLKIRGLHITY